MLLAPDGGGRWGSYVPPKRSEWPNSQTLDALRQGGWNVPSQFSGTKPVANADKWQFKGSPVALKDYSYGLTHEEWQRIRDEFEGRKGFTAPKYGAPSKPSTQTDTGYGSGMSAKEGPPPEFLPTANMEPTQAQPLSYDQYLKLSPDQKAAVDLNALWINAREKDLQETAKPTEEQQKVYDKDVEKIFGPGKGSTKFAPETVALVKQLNLNLPGWDLDQVLALDYAIDTEDLANFEVKGARPQEIYGAGATGDQQRVYNLYRSEEGQQRNLVEAVRRSREAIEAAFSDLYSVRGDVVSTMAAGRKADVTSYGGTEMQVPDQAGYPLAYPQGIEPKGLDDEAKGRNLFYTSAYEIIANRKKPLTDLWELVAKSPAADDENELKALFAYFDQRTRQETQYGRPKGLDGTDYRSPEEIRAWAGLDL